MAHAIGHNSGVRQQAPANRPHGGGNCQAAGHTAQAGHAHGPCETAALSPTALREQAYAKSSAAFDKMTGAFNNLPEADKVSLGKAIGTKLKASKTEMEAKLGKPLTEAQAAELQWDTMASVSADWAGNKAATGGQLDKAGAKNLGDLYYGATNYLKFRAEYLQNGGTIGQ